MLRKSPAVEGWRWKRTKLAAQDNGPQAKRGLRASAETIRRGLRQLGWRWKRTKLAAQDNGPQRAPKLAHIRWVWATLRPRQVLLFADELDIPLLPKSG